MRAENRADLASSVQIPSAVAENLVRYVQTLDEAVTLTFGHDAWL
jgi:hypothetical protein